jgi:hypothetical protein
LRDDAAEAFDPEQSGHMPARPRALTAPFGSESTTRAPESKIPRDMSERSPLRSLLSARYELDTLGAL